jgi:hypothetical protein
MAFGLKVKNSYEDTIIDGEWPNYTKIQDGVIPFTMESTGGNGDRSLSLVITLSTPCTHSSPPILLIRPNGAIDGAVYLAYAAPLGAPGGWTGFKISFRQPYNSSTSYKSLQYRVYGVQPALVSAWGMRVFSPDGAIVFDSSYQQLILESVITSSDWALTVNLPGTTDNWLTWYQAHQTALLTNTYISVSTMNFLSAYGVNGSALYIRELHWGGGMLMMTTKAFNGGSGYGPPLEAQPIFCDL